VQRRTAHSGDGYPIGADAMNRNGTGTVRKSENLKPRGNGRHEETRTPDLYRVKVAL
jgi:hypothetical protein